MQSNVANATTNAELFNHSLSYICSYLCGCLADVRYEYRKANRSHSHCRLKQRVSDTKQSSKKKRVNARYRLRAQIHRPASAGFCHYQ